MPPLIPALPIPPTPAASAAGEAKVLLAFQSLRDGFRSYHRKNWYSFDGLDGSREEVREGEADFLVLNPDLGMLVLEVKGGRIAFDGRTGAWTSTARDGTVYGIKDPFLQALRSIGDRKRRRGAELRGAGDDGVRSGTGSSSPTATSRPGPAG
jgi:hypothetical protein